MPADRVVNPSHIPSHTHAPFNDGWNLFFNSKSGILSVNVPAPVNELPPPNAQVPRGYLGCSYPPFCILSIHVLFLCKHGRGYQGVTDQGVMRPKRDARTRENRCSQLCQNGVYDIFCGPRYAPAGASLQREAKRYAVVVCALEQPHIGLPRATVKVDSWPAREGIYCCTQKSDAQILKWIIFGNTCERSVP